MGTKSKFLHFYDATIHFAHRSKMEEYKESLYRDLRNAASSCPVSLFVFDEMHHMPDGILDILAPVLDIRESLDGIDFRRSIFLFLR
ncbi:putative torsin A [Fasciola hepatica]|uniref:Torsin A n=1 Tax=Fasciola hepatica TaxID=6192 RepID=A0A4E0QZF9_FASHE|nr:putative torsin A [Fasciola hepatica]